MAAAKPIEVSSTTQAAAPLSTTPALFTEMTAAVSATPAEAPAEALSVTPAESPSKSVETVVRRGKIRDDRLGAVYHTCRCEVPPDASFATLTEASPPGEVPSVKSAEARRRLRHPPRFSLSHPLRRRL